ncbi:MAG: PhzF family phenazine biosynthesis protein [Candidatus Zixiibacteriota bacterium]|nr:MAG: PhzF family phenazine biosynthesis protein [candidate division Zixibacteria bacterium]
MVQKIYLVDAFACRPFVGNPAGVCILDKAASAQWMQNVAAEINASETAFLYPTEDGYNLRWFTPVVEVEICGHATLASAHILWEQRILRRDQQVRFFTHRGVLTADWADGWIRMDFPSEPPRAVAPPAGLLDALGTSADYVGKNETRYLVEVESEQVVRDLAPDIAAVLKAGGKRVIVTSRAEDTKYDFVSRFFAPGMGISEDPVTGSAHCCLAPYWGERLDKTELTAYQASRRGGELKLQVAGDRVIIFGQAVTVLEAEMK